MPFLIYVTGVEISSFTPPAVSSSVHLFLLFSFTPLTLLSLLPNPDIRNPISHFYQAVRSSIIHHVVDASTSTSTSRRLRRFKNGFLISHVSTSSDWEYKSITRYPPLSIYASMYSHFKDLSYSVPFRSSSLIPPMVLHHTSSSIPPWSQLLFLISQPLSLCPRVHLSPSYLTALPLIS